jgi:hypothetical protein
MNATSAIAAGAPVTTTAGERARCRILRRVRREMSEEIPKQPLPGQFAPGYTMDFDEPIRMSRDFDATFLVRC